MNNIKCDENCSECRKYTTVHSDGEVIKYDCLITGKEVVKKVGDSE